MIAIIDYQMGNLRSVQKGFEKVGHQADDHQRSGGAGRGRQDRPARASARSATPWPSSSGGIWSSRSARRSPPASRFWASAWACNCCSTSATRGAATRAGRAGRAKSCGSICRPIQSAAHGLEPVADPPAGAGVGRAGRRHALLLRPLLLRRAARCRRRSPPKPTTAGRSARWSGATTSLPRSFIPKRARPTD